MGVQTKRANNVLALHDSSGMYGAEKVILNLGIALKETDFNMIVGCLTNYRKTKPELGKEAERMGLDVEYFPMKIRFDPFVIRSVSDRIRKSDVRLVHAHGYKSNLVGLISARMRGIPVITTNHLFPPMPLSDKKLQFYSKLDVFLSLRRLDMIIAVSEDIRKRLIERGVEEARIVCIENGVDLDGYQAPDGWGRSEFKKSLGIKTDSFVIGTLGRLTPQKAHHVLLKAAKRVIVEKPFAVFIIAGDGFLKDELKEYAEQLKISQNVKFLGFRSDTRRLLSIMDVFVLSSIDEGLPMAMLEAMAAKLPVVATSVGDIPKVIKNDENGLLVEPKNSNALADKILFLLDSPTVRKTIGIKGFETVKEYYSKEAMCKKYLSVYEALIKNEVEPH